MINQPDDCRVECGDTSLGSLMGTRSTYVGFSPKKQQNVIYNYPLIRIGYIFNLYHAFVGMRRSHHITSSMNSKHDRVDKPKQLASVGLHADDAQNSGFAKTGQTGEFTIFKK